MRRGVLVSNPSSSMVEVGGLPLPAGWRSLAGLSPASLFSLLRLPPSLPAPSLRAGRRLRPSPCRCLPSFFSFGASTASTATASTPAVISATSASASASASASVVSPPFGASETSFSGSCSSSVSSAAQSTGVLGAEMDSAASD